MRAVALALTACATPPAAPALALGRVPDPGPRLPAGAEPVSYDLQLDVDPASEDFIGHVIIRVTLAAPTDRIWLNADELEITSARYQLANTSAPLALAATGDQMLAFGFARMVPAGEVTLAIDYTGHMRHDQEGLFRQDRDGKTYVFAQSESAFARRITPCFDEPRWKVPWHVTVVVPRGMVAVANAPEERALELADGRHEVVFAPTPAMASYLFAIAVGPFELVDAGVVGRRRVPLRVASLAGEGKLADVARAQVPAIVDAAEAMLHDDLPLAKLDLVAVPDLFGAMENPGLVTIDRDILVAYAGVPASVRHFIEVAAHEIVHQWFGNLVTPRWWDDLWLGEAFASWLGDRIAERVGAMEDPALARALARERALVADALPDARPLRHVIVRPDDAEDAFGPIEYDKGSAVLATVAGWIGEDTFTTWTLAYLRAHRGGTATARDLYAVLAKPAARALASYVERAGTPIVALSLHCAGAATLVARPRGSFAVPVCVRYGDARTSHAACALVAEQTEIPFDGGCPTWVVGNARGGYYEVAWPGSGPLGPLPPPAALAPGEAIAVGDDVASAFTRGDATAVEAIAALDRLVGARSSYALLGALAIARAIDEMVDEATRPAWSAWLARRFASQLEAPALFTPRSLAELAVRDELVRLIDPANLPSSTIAEALRVVHGKRGVTLLHSWAAGLDDATRSLARWLEAGQDAKGDWTWMEGLDRSPARATTWRALRPELARVLDALGGDAWQLIDAAGALCESDARDALSAAYAPRAHDARERRRLARTLARIDRCVAARRVRAGEVAAALASSR
jgi:alanyl aminopeptidase